MDGDGAFHRFYACPGAHDSVITSLLPMMFSDGYHIKNKEFRYQLIGSLALTNQRTAFINAIAIVPVEISEHWTWFFQHLDRGNMGRRLHSGKILLMGDREKGELNAGQTVFPESLAAACTRHILKNMEKQHLISKRGSDSSLWLRVARAATVEELDAWLDQLQLTYPKQAAFLSTIPPTFTA